jgi:hypothetical protein
MLVKLTPGFKLSYYNVLFWKKWASRGHEGEGGTHLLQDCQRPLENKILLVYNYNKSNFKYV